MNGISAIEALFNGDIIYKGYFKSEKDEWFVEYDKNNKTFKFGSGWIKEINSKNIEHILPYFLYVILQSEWQIYSD